MHVPDGFLDPATSVATGLVATAAVALALERSRYELHEVGAQRAGLVACFIFAAQMVNFPVGAGTSGHLIGGVLAAALLGPWSSLLVMTCVLLVQTLLFADGGLTALGANIVLLAVVPAGVSALLWPVMTRWTRLGAGIAAYLSVPLAALAFTGLYAIGGQVPIPMGLLTAAMVGTHGVIGIGESILTVAILSAILAIRPDLVRVADGKRPELVVKGQIVVVPPTPAPRPHPRVLATSLGVTALLAGGVSLLASAAPDGLESVAQRLGFESAANESAASNSPLADYTLLGGGGWGTTVAGLVGVLVTLAVAYALAALVKRRARGVR